MINPINETIEVGTKPILIVEEEKLSYSESIIMTATAYDLSYESTGKNLGDAGYGITYSGTKAEHGTVAVDPTVIPLGTKLYIQSIDGSEDYGFAVAEDIGAKIKGNRIDLFMFDHNKAIDFGKKDVKVYILKD